MSRRKGNTIAGSWVPHTRDMLESPAWRRLSNNARRVLERLELEHMRHGGAENGSLVCPYAHFVAAGIARRSVASAIRQCVILGFLEITQRGGCSIANQRWSSRYRLTYLPGRGSSPGATNEWQRIKTHAMARSLRSVAVNQRNPETQIRTRKFRWSAPTVVEVFGADADEIRASIDRKSSWQN